MSHSAAPGGSSVNMRISGDTFQAACISQVSFLQQNRISCCPFQKFRLGGVGCHVPERTTLDGARLERTFVQSLPTSPADGCEANIQRDKEGAQRTSQEWTWGWHFMARPAPISSPSFRIFSSNCCSERSLGMQRQKVA